MAKGKLPPWLQKGGKATPTVTGPSPHPNMPGAAKGKRKKAMPTGGQAAMTTAQQLGAGSGMKPGSKPGAKPW
jgi:hypothetical protein